MGEEPARGLFCRLARLFALPEPAAPVPLPESPRITLDELKAVLKAKESLAGKRLPQNLREFDFRNANLAKADFADADVTDANFRDADLREADLSKVKGLIPAQLAGADLTRCRLPDEVKGFPQLENVKEISKNAGALFLTMVLACVFVLITTVSTRDIQLLTNTGTAQLPVLNVAVATAVFFTIAPIVLILLYVTVHLYLQRLWALMATLPAYFPDGTRIERKTYPWLLNDLIQAAFPRLRPKGWHFLFSQTWLFAFVPYNFVPFTVFIVWLRCLANHDSSLSFWQAIFFAASVVAGPVMKAYHWRTMGESAQRFAWRGLSVVASLALATVPFMANDAVRTSFTTSPSVAQRAMLASLRLISFKEGEYKAEGFPERIQRLETEGTNGLPLKLDERDRNAIQRAEAKRKDLEPSSWLVGTVRRVLTIQPFFSGFGDLTEDISRRPEKWAEKGGAASLEPTKEESERLATGDSEGFRNRLQNDVRREVGDVPRAAFVRIGNPHAPNLRFLRARGAFLVNADFRGADLTGADFSDADLRGSLWRDDTVEIEKRGRIVNLNFATLPRVILTGTNLTGATLTEAYLFRSTLVGTRLSEATLTGADLSGATLVGADLHHATLTGADLSHTILAGTKMSEATLTAANLSLANLTGADLSLANLTGADLSQANLKGANLSDATLTGAFMYEATLAGTNLSGADFRGSYGLEQANINGAIYDPTVLPKWPQGWRSNPLSYSYLGRFALTYRSVPFINPVSGIRYIRLERIDPH